MHRGAVIGYVLLAIAMFLLTRLSVFVVPRLDQHILVLFQRRKYALVTGSVRNAGKYVSDPDMTATNAVRTDRKVHSLNRKVKVDTVHEIEVEVAIEVANVVALAVDHVNVVVFAVEVESEDIAVDLVTDMLVSDTTIDLIVFLKRLNFFLKQIWN